MKLERIHVNYEDGIEINGRWTGPCIAGKIKGEDKMVVLALLKRPSEGIDQRRFKAICSHIVLPTIPADILEA